MSSGAHVGRCSKKQLHSRLGHSRDDDDDDDDNHWDNQVKALTANYQTN